MKFTLEYIANVCGQLSQSANPQREVEGFFTDSRTPSENKLFLALRGERVDGNSFVPALVSQGCAVMTDREENLSCAGDVIYVQDVRKAIQKLATHYRNNELNNVKILGITGSVGKTTTKEMVALALSCELEIHKTEGNANSQIGLPQTLLATPQGVDCAVVELGMSEKGEMERIARCASPDIAIITNIGYSHIENLGTREAIRDEKLKIAISSPENAVMILNGDEPLLRSTDYGKKNTCFVSYEDNSCDCYAKNITEDRFGVSFVGVIFDNEIEVRLSVRGTHFVTNALFALAAAHYLGISLNKAANALNEYKSDGKRQFIYETNGHTVISDCYNASPESMKAALSVLKSSQGRRIAVLGDMLELGSETISLHKLVGSYVNDSADVLVTYGELARYIASAAKICQIYSFDKDDFEDLKAFLQDFIKEGDTVLYKASNGMKLDRVIV